MKRAYCTAWFDRRTMDLLIVGGSNSTDKAMVDCERFNLIKRTSVLVNPLVEQRTNHSMCEVNIGNDRFL